MHSAKRKLSWIAALALIAVLAAMGAWSYLRAFASPNALWTIVQSCLAEQERGRVPPGKCVSVDRKNEVAILRSIEGRWQYLAIPTIRVTGIEDPQVKNPRLPNYWASAWSAASKYLPSSVTKNRADVGLAINSVAGRSQNQLHVHISCVKPDIIRMLDADRSEIGTTWSRPILTVGNHRYRVMRVESPTLSQANPFLLLLKLPGASQHMGLHTLVATGATWDHGNKSGFYVLDDYTHDTNAGQDRGHGEELLDEDCRGRT